MTMCEKTFQALTTRKAIYHRIRWMAKDQEWKPSKSRKTGVWLWYFENTQNEPVKGLTDQQALQWLLDGMECPSTVDFVICGGNHENL